jgi:tetraacyldisaccharide 4'-kinase
MASHFLPVRIPLAAAAAGYWAVQKTREKAYQRRILTGRKAPIPVVSIGNILMGGSGKTPFVIYLGEMIQDRGRKPAVVSRGYMGRYRDPCLVVGDGTSDGPLVDPSVSGEEPFLIAGRLPQVPVLVGRRRIDPVLEAYRRFGSDLIILDDGFQHLALRRDVDIVLITGSEDCMFPLGRLREPFSALERADILVLVGKDAEVPRRAASYVRGLPVFRCTQVPLDLETAHGSDRLEDYSAAEVLLVSGIANPFRFRLTSMELGWQVTEHLVFPDHYCLTEAELRGILAKAGKALVVVTEKDWVKLPAWFKQTGQVAALRIGIVMDEEQAFWKTLNDHLERRAEAKGCRGASQRPS